jgi:hypothetical protein
MTKIKDKTPKTMSKDTHPWLTMPTKSNKGNPKGMAIDDP